VSDSKVKMKLLEAGLAAALATIASAAPAQNEAKRATTPKVYLAGDSTMALGGGGTGTQGMFPHLLSPLLF
jgi:rhamnogalacturonan acetylesterase